MSLGLRSRIALKKKAKPQPAYRTAITARDVQASVKAAHDRQIDDLMKAMAVEKQRTIDCVKAIQALGSLMPQYNATIGIAPTASQVTIPITHHNIVKVTQGNSPTYNTANLTLSSQSLGNSVSGEMVVSRGRQLSLQLPDGGRLDVEADGSYKLIDDNAKITYAANRSRAFNPYVSSSDLLEEFIGFCADLGHITKRDFLDLPIELFIRWLAIRAAEADGDDNVSYAEVREHPALNKPDVKSLPEPGASGLTVCRHCGITMSDKLIAAGIEFCSTAHYVEFTEEVLA